MIAPRNHLKRLTLGVLALFASFVSAWAQYIGVTCGWQYSAQLSGPVSYPTHANISLYNPDPANPNATWDSWAEQLAQSGVDFICPNLTGSNPNANGSPSKMLPLLNAIRHQGLTNRIKFAAFDDNAASWTAQWNMANGRGYGYAQKFDMADTNNWRFIYDYNYKIFFETIPDENRFKINGRPLIIIWSGNTVTFLTNMQGNASRAILHVRKRCQEDFGFNPFIVLSQDFFSNDSTCNNPGVADGSHSWFTAGPNGPSHTLTIKNGTRVGVAVPQFQRAGHSGFLDPAHGALFETGLSNTVGQNALFTLCEGFTDYEEDAAMWRVRNLSTDGSVLGYTETYYDYPNQRLNILRRHSNWPFPPQLKFEAEGCDYFGGTAGGNGKLNYYRNGNIAIEPASDDGGGHDIGWIQPGEWFEWLEVPMQGSAVRLQARVASPNENCRLHFQVDGTNYPAIQIPNTGGYQVWTTVESGPISFPRGSYHTVRIICDTGGFNLNYWQYRTAIPFNGNVRLQAMSNNKWVSMAHTNLTADANVLSVNELFTVVDASSNGYGYGHVALKALANGKFVSADTNGIQPLSTSAEQLTDEEIFQWTDNADGTISLRALTTSKLVSVTNYSDAVSLIPSRIRNAGMAEQFALTQVSSNTLRFVSEPNDAVSGAPITAGDLPEVQVLALDPSGAAVSGVVVNLFLASGSGTLTGNSAITDENGIAHFNNLTIDLAGEKTLGAISGVFMAAESQPFPVFPGPAAQLKIETAPDGSGTEYVGGVITLYSSVTVYSVLRDAGGNFLFNAPATWSLIDLAGNISANDLVVAPDHRSAIFNSHAAGSSRIQALGDFVGISGVLLVLDPTVTFESGTFTDNSVLALTGPPSWQEYGVNLGAATSQTSANGYTFNGFPDSRVSYGGSGGYGLAAFLGGGGGSSDSHFDTVLHSAFLGINNGVLRLSDLTVGATYKLLVLSADTRPGVGARAFGIASTGGSSGNQFYAFPGGATALGGYVLATFVASDSTKTFTNTQAGYGYQLNAILLGRVPVNTSPIVVKTSIESTRLTLVGTNGAPGFLYRVLCATNLNAAADMWRPVLTNTFDESGNFQFSIPIRGDEKSMFYRLAVP